jgi:hypothetical protein
LKLKCDVLLPTSAFKLNLRRYNTAGSGVVSFFEWAQGLATVLQAGAYTRPLFGSTQALSVGQGLHLGVA